MKVFPDAECAGGSDISFQLQNNPTSADTDTVTDTSSHSPDTNTTVQLNQADTVADTAQDPVPETNGENQETDHATQQNNADNRQAADSRRTSNRERRARDMYGDWDTSNRRRGYKRR